MTEHNKISETESTVAYQQKDSGCSLTMIFNRNEKTVDISQAILVRNNEPMLEPMESLYDNAKIHKEQDNVCARNGRDGETKSSDASLMKAKDYFDAKRNAAHQEAVPVTEQREEVITLTVAECGEFHTLGEYHKGIKSADEAVKIFNQIPADRMNGIPSIGICIHTEGAEPYEDVEMDIVTGHTIDLTLLDYVPEISENPKALMLLEELVEQALRDRPTMRVLI